MMLVYFVYFVTLVLEVILAVNEVWTGLLLTLLLLLHDDSICLDISGVKSTSDMSAVL